MSIGVDFGSASELQQQVQALRTENAALKQQRDKLLAEMEKLARLGNGDQYGNSDGNMIARAAIASVKGGAALAKIEGEKNHGSR